MKDDPMADEHILFDRDRMILGGFDQYLIQKDRSVSYHNSVAIRPEDSQGPYAYIWPKNDISDQPGGGIDKDAFVKLRGFSFKWGDV
jgi:hypothetical protein